MAVVGTAQVLIVPTFTGLQKAIGKGLVKPLQEHTQTRDLGTRIGDRVIGGMGKALKAGAVTTIAGAGLAIGTALTSGFQRLQAIEQAEAKLAGLGHTTEGVEAIMNDALAAVKGTSFGMGEAATTAASVVAAGVKPGEELQRTLTLVGDAATIAGTDMATMGSIVNKVATADMMQMDVANQMMDAGIPILQMVGDELGVTAEEARKMASAGEVSFETFQNALETGVGGAALESGNTLQGAFKNTIASLGRIGASLLGPLYAAGTGFFNWAMDMLGPVEEWAESVAPMIEDALQGFVGWIKSDLLPTAQRIGDVLASVAGWVVRNKDYLIPLGIALGTVVGAWVAWYTAIGVWNRIVTIGTKIQAAFNFVMNANPILRIGSIILAVGAALVWFFTQTETGKNIWAGFVGFLGDAWDWLWNDILSPVFTWIGEAWGNLTQWFADAWNNTLKPVWDAISTAALWLWNTVLSPVFTWIGDHWKYVILGIQWYWNNVLKRVWDAVSVAAQWLWNSVLSPVFTWIGNTWSNILDGMKWAWDNVLRPAWDAIVRAAQWMWNNVLSPIFGWIGEKWDNILKGMEVVYNDYLKPMFDRFGDAVQGLRDTFDTAVDNIKKAWDKIREVAAKPINFVIGRVINEGLIDGFNKLVTWIPGVDGLKHVERPDWLKEFGYAAGGYTGDGGKYEPAGVVHKGEYVIPKESTASLMRTIGIGGLEYMRHHGRLPGYASGGLVRPVDGPLTSRFGRRWGGHHSGVDWAVPVGTPVRAALGGTVARARWNAVTGRTGLGVLLSHDGHRNTYYGHLSQLRVQPRDQVAKGQIIGLSGNTGNSTGPHLHFETWTGGKPVNPLKYMDGLPASDSWGDSEGSGWNVLTPLRALGDAIASTMKKAFPDGGIMVDAAIEGTKEKYNQILDFVGGLLGMSTDGSEGGPAVDDAKAQVRAVAAQYGWDSGEQWSALEELVRRESSWNIHAANPSSSARGLFQKMTSIHGPVEGNATAQAKWGLNYIKQRYVSPRTALDFHNRNNWYADGGLVDDPNVLFRDRGGVLPPGLSMVLNKTGQNEAILNHRQWSDIHKLASRGASGNTYHIDARGQGQMTANDLVHRIDFETTRRAKGGVYA